MAQDQRGGPPGRTDKPGGNRPGGERSGAPRRDGGPGGNRGGNRGPGKGRFDKGSDKPVRVETYTNVGEVTRGAGFRIEKSVIADKATHKPITTEYRLYREGLAERQVFARLADAITASTEPLPEPEAEPEAEVSAEAEAEPATAEAEAEAPAEEAPAEE